MAIRDRFKDAPWFKTSGEDIIIGGAGGIGSWLAFLLARAGYNINIFDFDSVEEHNIGGQLFRVKDVGRSKVDALEEIIREGSELSINTFNEAFTSESFGHYIMFSAFDNMVARKDMFKVWKEVAKENPNAIFIDGRLLFEQMQVLCVTVDTMDQYEEEYLFDDSEVEDGMCTMKQTSHTAAMIASFMVAFFTNHMTNIVNKDKGRQVPFLHEYFIPVNLVS